MKIKPSQFDNTELFRYFRIPTKDSDQNNFVWRRSIADMVPTNLVDFLIDKKRYYVVGT